MIRLYMARSSIKNKYLSRRASGGGTIPRRILGRISLRAINCHQKGMYLKIRKSDSS
jgi:hypothetical protein